MIKILSFGAVLWDIAQNEKHLGGAPLNLTANLKKLGVDSYLYTKLGTDEFGVTAKKEIEKLGIKNSFIQIDESKKTGYAKIVYDESRSATYEFCPEASHEYIEADEELIKKIQSEKFDFFCYGTYCQQGTQTKKTLKKILQSCSFPTVFCDINIREAYPPKEMIEDSLRFANILKLNDEEVVRLDTLLYKAEQTEEEAIVALKRDYQIDIVCVTKGQDGCTVYDMEGKRLHVTTKPAKAVDTVGAGDAFSAAFIISYSRGKSLQECAEDGNLLGGFVAEHRGAIVEYDEKIKNILCSEEG